MTKKELIERTVAEEDADKAILNGDLVHLKSGGPTMTVRSIVVDDVECEWFDKGALRKHEFKLHSLRRGPHSKTPIINFNIVEGPSSGNEKPPWQSEADSEDREPTV